MAVGIAKFARKLMKIRNNLHLPAKAVCKVGHFIDEVCKNVSSKNKGRCRDGAVCH